MKDVVGSRAMIACFGSSIRPRNGGPFSGAYDNKTVIKFIKDYGFNQPHKAFSPSASTSEDFISENVK